MDIKQIKQFNIRVYGIFINKQNQVLVTDEYRLNQYMTKFPGGGLELGEGIIDCLKRECIEELGHEAFNISHFYTTDFFQPTTLINGKPQQLISIYYTMELHEPYRFKTTNTKYNFEKIDGMQSFRWVSLNNLSEQDFTFPIDKHVAGLLKNTIPHSK